MTLIGHPLSFIADQLRSASIGGLIGAFIAGEQAKEWLTPVRLGCARKHFQPIEHEVWYVCGGRYEWDVTFDSSSNLASLGIHYVFDYEYSVSLVPTYLLVIGGAVVGLAVGILVKAIYNVRYGPLDTEAAMFAAIAEDASGRPVTN